jgi:hypothetical protein
MIKLQHVMIAEESIAHFIDFIEDRTGFIEEEDKKWLFAKGREIFESYYVDTQVTVNLVTEKDKAALNGYFDVVQDSLGRMFAHIMTMEFKFHLISKGK